jgi:hypothetical protein
MASVDVILSTKLPYSRFKRLPGRQRQIMQSDGRDALREAGREIACGLWPGLRSGGVPSLDIPLSHCAALQDTAVDAATVTSIMVTIGYPEDWAASKKRNRAFLDRFPDLGATLDVAFVRTFHASEPLGKVFFFSGRLCAEDFAGKFEAAPRVLASS